TRPATGWPRGASLRTFDLEVVVEADAADDAEAEARHDGDGGTDFREDAAFRHAGFCEAELAADEQVHAGVEARADTEADTAACVDADGGVTHVDTQVVQGVDTDGEAGGADVVVARVDADRQAGRHVFDTEVQSRAGVPRADASPIALRERGAGAEGGDGDQGDQKLAHANPPNRSEKTWTFSSPARL